jgi:2,4-dienoyl-CoA reductase-like NADH-dependent reductase (Old Yellow Enzyme family)
LFSPLRLKSIELRNRFIVPSMQRSRCRDGKPSTEVAAYYRQRAEGGFSLILGESCAVDHPSASQKAGCLRMNAETKMAWRDCVDGVVRAGSHMFIQLWHEGAVRDDQAPGPYAGYPTLSPSGLVVGGRQQGRSATIPELQDIKDAYVRSAAMAKEIGAAGVELHGGHGFLLDQFLWAETNLRGDHYGGEGIEHRLRFPAEVVAAVRREVGDDFLISFRFSQWKELNYHSARIVESSEELAVLLRALRTAGVDMFNVSTRRFYRPEWNGSDLGLAGWTKALTGAPVVTVGGVGLDNDVIECLIEGVPAVNNLAGSLAELLRRFERGEFDLVAVGRASIGDPQWVNKVAAGRFDDITVFNREALLAAMGWDSADAEVVWAKDMPVRA